MLVSGSVVVSGTLPCDSGNTGDSCSACLRVDDGASRRSRGISMTKTHPSPDTPLEITPILPSWQSTIALETIHVHVYVSMFVVRDKTTVIGLLRAVTVLGKYSMVHA